MSSHASTDERAIIGPNTLIRTADGSILPAWDVSSRGLVGIHPVSAPTIDPDGPVPAPELRDAPLGGESS